MATQLQRRDYFSDADLLVDPYSYFRAVRGINPVHKVEHRDLMLVTGYEECRQILADNELFSSISASPGPATPLPFEPHGEDITALLEEHRPTMQSNDLVVSMDGLQHQRTRSLLNKLFIPSRLKANQEFMTALAHRMVDEIVSRGHCDMIGEVATPFVTLVIADLFGVPDDDRDMFRDVLANLPTVYDVSEPDRTKVGPNRYLEMGDIFHAYIEDRRTNPRDDILTQISQATYGDGTTPTATELVKVLLTLFGGGQDTSAKLLGNSVRYLCENPAMQDDLRGNPTLIPAFIEEMMRLEGSTKITSRVALLRTKVGEVDVPAGTILAVSLAGANRDPRRFEDPDAFKLNRPRVIEHLGFGRGAHTCIGAPLARAEVRIFLTRMLEKTSSITLSEPHHGPKEGRKLRYEPSYGMRGLAELFVDMRPA